MSFKDAVTLIYRRLRFIPHRWGVILLQSSFSVPRHKKRLVVYLTPGDVLVNGGVMSIYNQATFSREALPDSAVVLSTYPKSPVIYAVNKEFPNEEHIWRWGQVSRLIPKYSEVMIHVPDYYVEGFYDDLMAGEKSMLKEHPNLAINIMDQNILLMPTSAKVDRLRSLTQKLTQTCAHTKYAGQEFADKFNLPTIWLPAYWNLDCYKKYSFELKEKRIVYSPDKHPRREEILDMLKREFPDFEFYEVWNIPFPKYTDIVSRSLFTITFGEGADGYFSGPLRQHSMSFAVYNTDFFSKEYDYLHVWNIFSSYDDLKQNIVAKMKECMQNEETYNKYVDEARDKLPYLKKTDAERVKVFYERLRRFYNNDFDCHPQNHAHA